MTITKIKFNHGPAYGLFVYVLFLVLNPVFAQTRISGVVVDGETQKPIGYADVSLPEAGTFAITNTDGSFYLETDQEITYLEVQQPGYFMKEVELPNQQNYELVIELDKDFENEVVTLDAAVATAHQRLKKKENPAYAILRKLWEKRKKNGLRAVPNYEYEEYEKIEFDLNNIDSALMNSVIFKKFEFVFEKIDTSNITGKAFLPAFLNENLYKVYGKNEPNHRERKDLIATQTSGFTDNEIVNNSIKNLYKEFDVYQNRLNFFNKNFVSPVARDGFSVYDYVLSDTVSLDEVECFRIKYFPKRDGEFTFKGEVYISNHTWAIKEITMQSTKGINVNFVRDMFATLEFDVVNDSVFLPKREYILLDMTLLNNKKKAKGVYAHRTVSYKNFDFKNPKPDAFYREEVDPYQTKSYKKSNEFWAERRHEKLKQNEEGIYETLDSLSQIPRFKRIVNTIEILASGYYNVGNAIDIGNLYSTFGFNDVEGLRLRAGARTYFSRNDMWRIGGYMAYGFKDNVFKYGAEARYMFNPKNRFQVGLGTKRDIEQLGSQLTTSEGILTRSFASSSVLNQGNNNLLSSLNRTNLYTSIELFDNFKARLDFTHDHIRSANPQEFQIDYFNDGFVKSTLIDVHASLSLQWRPGAKYSLYGIDRFEHSSLAPTLLLRYTRGFDGMFNSEFDYNKLTFFYNQPILLGSWGRSDVTFEAGRTFDPVPLSLLSVIPGNETFGYVPGTFAQLDFYEFVTDTYSTLVVDHHFNGWFMNKLPLLKKTKLRTVAFARMAWGEISDQSVAINRGSVDYLAPDKNIYYEYGFGIENIGIGNIRPLRINFNWRGNYLDLPDARAFGITLGMDFSF